MKKPGEFKNLLAIAAVIVTGLLAGFMLSNVINHRGLPGIGDEYPDIRASNITERSLDRFDSREVISEDENLTSFKLSLNDSGAIRASYSGGSWYRQSGIMVGKLHPGNWTKWPEWEGGRNYSNRFDGFEVITKPSSQNDRKAILSRNVTVPERGLTVFSVQLNPAIVPRDESVNLENACTPEESTITLEAYRSGEEYTLNSRPITDSEFEINTSLERFEGSEVEIALVHRKGICSMIIERFAVTNYYSG